MKTLYSSTFLSAIFGFLMLVGQTETPITLEKGKDQSFRTILRTEAPSTPQSRVQMTVFTGFNCPDCRNFGRFSLTALHETLNKEAVDLEVVLVVNMEEESDVLGAKASYCAGEQDQFWAMLSALFEMEVIEEALIQEKMVEWELDEEVFNSCLESETTQVSVEKSLERWAANPLETLPSTQLHDVSLVGDHPLENIEREIRRLTSQLTFEN